MGTEIENVDEPTPEMIRVGVEVLREWVSEEDRFAGWDFLTIHDVYVRMRESYHRSYIQTRNAKTLP
jgi:hypothetical protein